MLYKGKDYSDNEILEILNNKDNDIIIKNILFLSYRTIIISSPIFLFVIFIIHKCIGINLQKKPRKWQNVLKRS